MNSDATLIAASTKQGIGHGVQAYDSVYVFRASDGKEVFRRHLDVVSTRSGPPVVRFTAANYFVYSYDGEIRVFRVVE